MRQLATHAALAALAAAALAAGPARAQHMAATHAFLAAAGASDKFEIEEARLAEARSRNPAVKRFAATMIRDHTDSTRKLTEAGEAGMGHRIAPPELTPDQQRMIAALRQTPARGFDRAYLDQQVPAHEKALDLMNDYAAHGDYPQIAATARDTAPVVRHHLEMARDLRRSLGQP